ncbi:MAG: hypothetical protein GY862_03200 [Gammaproteobacteria bacterium]|nr:hypothetical protein [Gammaproteobacteria bacterium]
MKKNSLSVITFLIIVLSIIEAFGFSGKFIHGTSFGGITKAGVYTLKLPIEKMKSAPSWNPGNELPVSIVQAVRITLNWAKSNYKPVEDVFISEIKLNQREKGFWYYYINFKKHPPVLILMDGSLVEPVICKRIEECSKINN